MYEYKTDYIRPIEETFFDKGQSVDDQFETLSKEGWNIIMCNDAYRGFGIFAKRRIRTKWWRTLVHAMWGNAPTTTKT